MQIHQIECFITIARLKSFSQAANSLYMTVPGVIKQINSLEQFLGFRLFERNNKGVSLTEAGKVFYEDAVKLVDLENKAVDNARFVAKVAGQRLNIGIVLPSHPMTSICAAYREQSKNQAMLAYKQITTRNAMDALLNREIDLYVCLGIPSPDKKGIRHEVLCRSHLYCILNANHPLNQKPVISLQDLEGETLILPPDGHLEYFDRFRAFVRSQYPGIQIETQENAISTYMTIEMNQSFSVTAMLRGLSTPALCYKPFDTGSWDQRIEICLIHRDEKNAYVEEFIDIAKKTIHA